MTKGETIMRLVKSFDQFKEEELRTAQRDLDFHKRYAEVLEAYIEQVKQAKQPHEIENAVEEFEKNEPQETK